MNIYEMNILYMFIYVYIYIYIYIYLFIYLYSYIQHFLLGITLERNDLLIVSIRYYVRSSG